MPDGSVPILLPVMVFPEPPSIQIPTRSLKGAPEKKLFMVRFLTAQLSDVILNPEQSMQAEPSMVMFCDSPSMTMPSCSMSGSCDAGEIVVLEMEKVMVAKPPMPLACCWVGAVICSATRA